MKFKSLLASGLLVPSLTFSTERPLLPQEDIQNVVSAIITLKSNCVTNKLTNCEAADAVLKTLRSTVQGTSDADINNHYLKKYGALFMEALIDASIEAKAAAK